MPAPFAALESRVNAAVFQRLSNAEGTLDGDPVQGIYLAKPLEALDEVGGFAPTFELSSASVPVDPRGLTLILTGIASFTVRDWDPDGTGVTTLQLEAV